MGTQSLSAADVGQGECQVRDSKRHNLNLEGGALNLCKWKGLFLRPGSGTNGLLAAATGAAAG